MKNRPKNLRLDSEKVPEKIDIRNISTLQQLNVTARLLHPKGFHTELKSLLAEMPLKLRSSEIYLFWKLTALSRLGKQGTLRAEVSVFLSKNPAPDLRALYAGVLLQGQEALQEAELAYQLKQTPLTTFQYGRLLTSNIERSLSIIHTSVELAEKQGQAYEIVRNAGLYTSRLIYAGHYSDAVYWGRWALDYFEKHDLEDTQRKMLLLNDWVYASLLTGNLAEVKPHIVKLQKPCALAAFERLFKSTVADYFLIVGKLDEAFELYEMLYKTTTRELLGKAALGYVRALVEQDDFDTALHIAQNALVLTKAKHAASHHPALLAYGIALSKTQPDMAVNNLKRFLSYYPASSFAHRQAQATLYLAKSYENLEDSTSAKTTLERSAELRGLDESGLKLLSGSAETFKNTWSLLPKSSVSLSLYFLGTTHVWLEQKALHLPLKLQEALLLLALHPEGLTAEQLELKLYGEKPAGRAITNVLSKLRKHIPLTHTPYQLALPFELDVQMLLAKLEQGDALSAVEAYKPLMADSVAPAIEVFRNYLENALREAVIKSNHPEALLLLANKLENDLEVWEKALEALPKKDPRTPLVEVRVNQIRKS